MVYHYLNITVRGSYIDYDYELTAENGHELGATYQEYLDQKWILLTEEQYAFKKENPGATVKEVLDMQLVVPTPEELLQQAKNSKIQEIEIRRSSSDVRKITYNGQDMWIEKSDRLAIKDRCSTVIQRGQTSIAVGNIFMNPSSAIEVINKLNDYDDACDKVKSDKIIAITNCVAVEEVESIEVVTGWPDVVSVTDAAIASEISAYQAKDPQVQATAFIKAIVNDFPMPANEALEKQVLFPVWGQKYAEMGKKVPVGFRFNYKKEEDPEYTMYEVIQEHSLSSAWVPGAGTESLYKVVQVEHAGTIDDPIPWQPNMELFKDKYYTEDGELYICIRNSEIALSYKLSELISGGYVEVVIQ